MADRLSLHNSELSAGWPPGRNFGPASLCPNGGKWGSSVVGGTAAAAAGQPIVVVASLDGGLRMGAVRSQGDAVGARAGARGGPLIGDCVRLRLLASIVLYAGDGKQQRAHRPHAEQQVRVSVS